MKTFSNGVYFWKLVKIPAFWETLRSELFPGTLIWPCFANLFWGICQAVRLIGPVCLLGTPEYIYLGFYFLWPFNFLTLGAIKIHILDSTEDDTEISSCEILCVNNNYYKDYCDKSKLIPSQNATTSLKSSKDSSKSSAKVMPLILDMLSEFCHSQILNVDYLLGQSSQPFTKTSAKQRQSRDSNEKKLKSYPVLPGLSSPSPTSSTSSEESKVLLKLKSGKMTSLKDLLFADKLNTNAIQLQLTALSQQTKVNVNLSSNDQESYSSRPKRSRRE